MRRGFTLFEMVVVLALFVVVTALAVPSIQGMYADYRLLAGVDQVRAQWAAMRARAATEGIPYRFAVMPNSGAFRVAPDRPEFWAGGDPPAPADGVDAPLVVQDALPKGIDFTFGDAAAAPTGGSGAQPAATAAPSDWMPVAVFLPDGTAREDVTIVMRMSNCTPQRLQLRALTGCVTCQPVLPGPAGR
jgi:prepilin-type N-terminal cleavage/methylation domain-containing protein